MSHHHKLSLFAAIVININIMLGTGIFINTVTLSQRAGLVGAFCYLLIGVMMLPLVLSIASLLGIHPSGGFYAYGAKEIHPFAGFFSSWSYFVGKLASAMLMIHTSILLLKPLFPVLMNADHMMLDVLVVGIFAALNMYNIKTGSFIQTGFLILKLIPILFLVFASLFICYGVPLAQGDLVWAGIPSSLPLVLYTTLGFEAACSLSSRIKDAHKNGPRAIFISYAIVMVLSFLYQFLFYIDLSDMLRTFSDYTYAFPALINQCMPYMKSTKILIEEFIHLAIAASALGGAYGIIFSNNWNLYTLAQHNHLIGSKSLIKLNSHEIPWLCVITEAVVCLTYLFLTRGDQIPLQQITGLGVVIAYSTSILSLIAAKKRSAEISIPWAIPLIALVNCGILIYACVANLLNEGAIALLTFGTLLVVGILMYFYTAKKN